MEIKRPPHGLLWKYKMLQFFPFYHRRTGTFGLAGGEGGGGALTFLPEKYTQCPNERVLKSKCINTQTA